MTNKNMALVCALRALSVFSIGTASAQDINANWFTHFAFDSSDAAEAADREIEWGESALFLTGNLGSKWSFLSELTFQPSKYRQKEFAAAGFEGVLTKPLDLQVLEKFLSSL